MAGANGVDGACHCIGERSRNRVGQVFAGQTRQVEHFSLTGLPRLDRPPTHQTATPAFGNQREDEIAAGIDVVRNDQQLAESWLTDVFRQQMPSATPPTICPSTIMRLRARPGS